MHTRIEAVCISVEISSFSYPLALCHIALLHCCPQFERLQLRHAFESLGALRMRQENRNGESKKF